MAEALAYEATIRRPPIEAHQITVLRTAATFNKYPGGRNPPGPYENSNKGCRLARINGIYSSQVQKHPLEMLLIGGFGGALWCVIVDRFANSLKRWSGLSFSSADLL